MEMIKRRSRALNRSLDAFVSSGTISGDSARRVKELQAKADRMRRYTNFVRESKNRGLNREQIEALLKDAQVAEQTGLKMYVRVGPGGKMYTRVFGAAAGDDQSSDQGTFAPAPLV